jgi:hypothetical protein
MTLTIWRLEGARQARYGIATARLNEFETLCESFGEADLSVESGRAVGAPVAGLPDDADYRTRWEALARLERWSKTYDQQQADREADRLADEED